MGAGLDETYGFEAAPDSRGGSCGQARGEAPDAHDVEPPDAPRLAAFDLAHAPAAHVAYIDANGGNVRVQADVRDEGAAAHPSARYFEAKEAAQVIFRQRAGKLVCVHPRDRVLLNKDGVLVPPLRGGVQADDGAEALEAADATEAEGAAGAAGVDVIAGVERFASAADSVDAVDPASVVEPSDASAAAPSKAARFSIDLRQLPFTLQAFCCINTQCPYPIGLDEVEDYARRLELNFSRTQRTMGPVRVLDPMDLQDELESIRMAAVGSIEAVSRLLYETIGRVESPFRTEIAHVFDYAERTANIQVFMPDFGVVPVCSYWMGADDMPPRRISDELAHAVYAQMIAAQALVVIASALCSAPWLERVLVSGFAQRDGEVTCEYTMNVAREDFASCRYREAGSAYETCEALGARFALGFGGDALGGDACDCGSDGDGSRYGGVSRSGNATASALMPSQRGLAPLGRLDFEKSRFCGFSELDSSGWPRISRVRLANLYQQLPVGFPMHKGDYALLCDAEGYDFDAAFADDDTARMLMEAASLIDAVGSFDVDALLGELAADLGDFEADDGVRDFVGMREHKTAIPAGGISVMEWEKALRQMRVSWSRGDDDTVRSIAAGLISLLLSPSAPYQDDDSRAYRCFNNDLERQMYMAGRKFAKEIVFVPSQVSRVLSFYGYVLVYHGDLEEAEQVLKEALRFNPVSSASYIHLSQLYWRQHRGDLSQKMALYAHKCSYRHPDLVMVFRTLADVLLERGELQFASALYHIALSYAGSPDELRLLDDNIKRIDAKLGRRLPQPNVEMRRKLAAKGFPSAPDRRVLALARALAQDASITRNKASAQLGWYVLATLTNDPNAAMRSRRLGGAGVRY